MAVADAMDDPRGNDEPLEMGGILLQPGARIGAYVFLREIGSGGMARVLLAKDPSGTLIALKVLRRSRFATGLVRFRREFRALSRIHHPNVVRVEAYGDLHGHPYIAMEYVDGPDLHALIRAFKSWEPEARWTRCEQILVELCRSLAAIHRRGLVHRDLKPSNVLIHKDGTCKLTDFGIVKDLDPSQDPHLSTTLVGTWAYASPEQISGQPIDHRSDLYSLGVILFAMLTGKRPFVANDMAGYLALHRDRPAPAPRDITPAVPEHLDEVCRRLLHKAPRDRFQSAQEILYRLEAEERRPTPSPSDGWEPPLVGRALELDAIAEAIAGLTAQRGGVVVLEGDDGSGKTRLLDEVVERARNLGVPFHREEFRQGAPVFKVLLGIVQDILKELGDKDIRDLREDLDDFSHGDGVVRDARYRVYDGAREAFVRALAEGPRLLVLDDLHEAHAREVHLLAFLVQKLLARDPVPLLVVATLRPHGSPAADRFAAGEDLGTAPMEMLVGPLSREDVAAVTVGLCGDNLPARLLAQRLHRETEGNATFLTEFIRALMAGGHMTLGAEGRWTPTMGMEEISNGHFEIPVGVRQMMKLRLDAVQNDDRRVLEVLAVGGREVDLDVVLDVLELDEEAVLDRLDHLMAAGIVRERRAGDVLLHSVSHRKFADVVYRDLDPERRSWLHRKMAAALELHYAQNPAALEVVGEHYRRAGDSGRAYRYLVAAAKRLADRSMMQEAWDLTEKAGALEDSAMADLPRVEFRSFRRDNLVVRAMVHYNRAEWVDSEKTWRAVLTLAEEDGDPRTACEARLRLATVLRRRGKHADSAMFAEQALEASRRLHHREGVADALHNMAALAWSNGDLDATERLANEGLLVAQGGQLADRRAELLLALTAAQATRGHLAAATSGLTEAEGIFRELRMKRPRCLALANIAELLVWQGEPLQARQRAHVAVELARELDYKLGRVAAGRAMAVAAMDLGLTEEAEAGLSESLELARAIELPEEVLACLVARVQLALEASDWDRARSEGEQGLTVVLQRDPERYKPVLVAQLAVALSTTDPERALQLLTEAEAAAPDAPVPRRTRVLLAAATARMRLGDLDGARALARQVLQMAGSRGLRTVSLEARALLVQLTTGDEQRTHRTVGQDLATDLTRALSPEMAKALQSRPLLAPLQR